MVIGSSADADLRVDDACVSGRHCVLDASGQDLVLVDLASKNGVYVGSVRVASAKLAANPTRFTIGKTSIIVRSGYQASPTSEREPIDGLEGESEPMLRLKRDIRRFARLSAPVLIVGEMGVGKDVVAHALHRLSGRKGAYVPLNAATIPESLADSELFGHKKGAFTGALQGRVGAFEQADRGTLFLDEIGELTPAIQAKLLRILEDGVVRAVGGSDSHRVDVRVITATWASLAERSAAGKFRFDLLQRLSMMVVEVPALRERRSDIPILADYWLRKHSAELGVKSLSATAIERLSVYDWPGNVRELGGAIFRAGVETDGDCIDADAIGRAIGGQTRRCRRAERNPEELLVQAGGNVSEAARRAGLPRTTFRTWLRRTKGPTSADAKQ
jgi:DNA-binding NtrC family response regulator